jgi:hypothetical protein
LTIVSLLAFPPTLKSGLVIETVGDAAAYFATNGREAVLDQPTYLKTATMSLQTAPLMEGLLASLLVVGGD